MLGDGLRDAFAEAGYDATPAGAADAVRPADDQGMP
jgi:hypothetical protein